MDEVRRIAALAGLELTPEEERRMVPELEAILGYVERLARFESAPPEAAAGEAEAGGEDRPAAGLAPGVFLANAPATRDGYLVVPRVIAERQERQG